ncbi:MAG: hypothetical protein OHK0028_15370 [Deltaproteobacteria bacterium]
MDRREFPQRKRGRGWTGGNRLAAKVTFAYLACGLFFLLVSERFLHSHTAGLPLWADDVFYILVTSVILYALVRHGTRAFRAKESELRESEDRLARILETNAGGVVVFDAGGRVTFGNHMACRILGIDRERILGLRHEEIPWEPADSGEASPTAGGSPFSRVRDSRSPVHDARYEIRRRDGSERFLTVNAAPLQDAAGRMVGIVASFIDITARKMMEDRKVRTLLLAAEQSPSAILISDPEGAVEYMNPLFAALTGVPAEEAAGRKDICTAGIPPEEAERIREAVRGGEPWRGEFHCLRRDGSPCRESVSVTPICSPDGETVNLLWVREDVTERWSSDQALKEIREKYKGLVETIYDWVWEIDPDAKYTYVSPKVRDLLGYDPEELSGKTPFDLMPSFEARRAADRFGTIVSRREPFHGLEYVYRHKTGRFVVVESGGAPFFDEAGVFRGYRGVDRDVGDRKRAEEMLKISEERFRQLFEQNEEPLFLFRNGTCEVFDVNPAAERMYGYSREELLKDGVSLFVPPEESQPFHAAIGGIRPGGGVSIERTTHVRKDGTRIFVSIRGKSIRLQTGPVAYCSFRDITARVRMEEEAKLHQAQLIHANRMASLGTIVSGVAHEVNNPNNLVMFNAPMILSAWEDAVPLLDAFAAENGEFSLGGLPYSEMRDVVPKLAKGISDASVRIKAIVSDLKDFARQDLDERHAPVRVNDVVRVAVSILNHEILRATHRFEVAYGEGIPPVPGSARQLEQVVINLMNNAIQALRSSRQGITVRTRAVPETGEVEVSVADEGVGMSREVMERTKEPFFSTRLDSGGLGLGLSICRSIVKAHRGNLTFESEEGRGTRTILRLPAIGDTMPEGPETTVPT